MKQIKYWFELSKQKKFWKPSTAISWLVMILYLLGIIIYIRAIFLNPHAYKLFLLQIAAMTLLLIYIVWRKGDPRQKKEKEEQS